MLIDKYKFHILLWAGAILFFLILFNNFFFKSEIFFSEDIMRTSLPLRKFATAEFNNFKIPYWNPYIFCGFPNFAEGQDGLFYPLNIILYYLFPVEYALTLSQISGYFLAVIFTFLLLRYFNISLLSSVLAGIIFSLSGFGITHYRNIAFICSYPYLPAILLFYIKFLNTKKKRYFIYSIFMLSLQFLSGHPQLPFLSILAVIVYLIYYLICNNKKSNCCTLNPISKILDFKKSYFKIIFLTILIIVFAVMLSAFQLLPIYKLSLECQNNDSSKFDYITYRSMPIYLYIQLLAPFCAGTHSFNCYYGKEDLFELTIFISITGILIILVNIKKLLKITELKYFWILIIFAIFFSIGSANPLYHIIAHIPGFNFFRVPARYNYLLTLSLAVLFGKSFDIFRFENIKLNKKFKIIIICIGLIILAVSIILFVSEKSLINNFKIQIENQNGFFYNKIHNIKKYGADFYLFKFKKIIEFQKWNFLVISIIYIINLVLFSVRNIRIKEIAFSVLILFEIFIFANIIIETVEPDFFSTPPTSVKFLYKEKEFYRIYSWNRGGMYSKFKYYDGYFYDKSPHYYLREFLHENYGTIFGIKNFSGDNTLIYSRYRDLEKLIKQGNYDILKLFGVKYLITDIPIQNIDEEQKYVGNTIMYELKNYNSFCFFTNKIINAESNEQALEIINSETRKMVLEKYVLLENYKGVVKNTDEVQQFKIKLKKYEPTKIEFELITNGSGIFILNESFYPEWHAKINGKEVKIYNANYLVKGIPIETKGVNNITFYYEDSGFKNGIYISVIAGLILIFFVVLL